MSGLAALDAQRTARRAAGLCIDCDHEAEDGLKRCAKHAAYHRDRKVAQRERRTAEGRCLYCETPVVEGDRVCERHAKLRTAQATARRTRRRAGRKAADVYAERKRALGLCKARGCTWKARYGDVCARHTEQGRRNAQAKRRRDFIDRRLESRLCVRCGWPNPSPRRCCADCRAEDITGHAERRMERKLIGVCMCGRKPVAGHSLCTKCAERARLAQAVRAHSRAEARICRSCSNPALPGVNICQAHQDMRRAQWLRRKLRSAGIVLR